MFNNFDLNSGIQVLILLIISGQLYFLHKTYRADHERRKKQATIEYLNSIRSDYRTLNDKLIDKFSTHPIKLDDIDEKMKKDIKQLLSILEHLSVGVNSGVYDFNILHRMSGSFLVGCYYQLHPHISKAQQNNPRYFIEFETLCKKIEHINKEKYHSNDGNIKFS
ncbi:MAG: DUF4760 domain-containing protein [Methylococcales bacterium]|nr:DUF4760 domain-containing protein [Methylococcales bacterium]